MDSVGATAKHVGDAISASAIIAAWAGWLSPILAAIASLCAILWFCIQVRDRIKYGPKQDTADPE